MSDIELSFEEVIALDIPIAAKRVLLEYTLGVDMEQKLKAYAGGIVLNTHELNYVGITPHNIKILRLVNRILED
jgi:hypothetical protein